MQKTMQKNNAAFLALQGIPKSIKLKKRPNIEQIKNGVELKKWYWLKKELVEYCKLEKLSYAGKKFDILERIGEYVDHGKIEKRGKEKHSGKIFNWSKERLTPHTIITANYTNSQNVSAFLKTQCGAKFKFNIRFMDWIKSNVGKTLAEAILEYNRLEVAKKQKDFQSEIPASNQYNQYLRDFFADNPSSSMKAARRCWKLKRALPLGKHIYERSDLKLS